MKKYTLKTIAFLFGLSISFSNIVNAQTVTIGTGITNLACNSGPTPYGAWYTSSRVQYLILASELNAAGLTGSKTLTSIAFYVPSVSCAGSTCPGGGVHLSFTIKLKNSSATVLTAFDNAGLTTVLNPVSYTTSIVNWNQHMFNTPFVWDGVSNLLVDACHDNTPSGSVCYSWSPQLTYTATTFNSTLHSWADGAGSYCGITGGTVYTQRANMQFTYTGGSGPTLPPIANFFQGVSDTTAGPMDTVWINSPQIIINTSSSQSRVYWDVEQYVPTGDTLLNAGYFRQNVNFSSQRYIDTSKYKNNLNYTFDKRGWWKLRLLAVNFLKSDSLRDSITKYIWVDTPSRVPTANFITFKKIVGFADQSSFIDLSDNGPNQWQWDYFPPCNKCSVMPFAPNYFDPNSAVPNPKFTGFDPGIYTICLRVWNARGTDSICKTDYIKVVNGYNMCSGTGSFGSQDAEGYIYGPSGPNFSYTRSQVGACPGFLINPCADSITLYVERLKMLPSDSLVFYNGTNATAPKIATIGASTGGQLPLPNNKKTIRGGRVIFVAFKLGGTAVPPGYDSAGFIIRWDMKPASYPKPIAAFNMVDTVYSTAPITLFNKSEGSLMQYSWDTDGNNVFDSVSASPTRTYIVTTPAIRRICLVSYNCVGVDTVCKNIVFLPVTQKPEARFTADKIAGFNTDTFRMIDKSLYGANQWRWSFVPATVQYLNGTNSTSQNPSIRFTAQTCYSAKLVATNSFGSDSLTKTAYICIAAYQTPSSSMAVEQVGDGSIGISRVRLNQIDSLFPNPIGPTYQYIYGNQSTTLYRGVKYYMQMYRPGTASAMDRKVWIDFNLNAAFENNELVTNELNAYTLIRTDSFVVGANQRVGTTRMRVAVDLGNSTQLNSVYATMGMFKDFSVAFGFDTIKPTIALNGGSVFRTEKNKPYLEPGVTAFDNLEGDISSRYVVFGTVDTTTVGPYYLKYIVQDLYGNTSDTAYRTVFVELNRTGPSISLVGGAIYHTNVNTSYVEPGYIAKDNLNNDITNQVVVLSNLDVSSLGNYLIKYTITDAFGFKAEISRIVIVQDTIAPIITAKFSNPHYHQVNQAFDALSAINWSDNYWTNILPTNIGLIDVNNVGSYYIAYRAIDGSGNISSTYYLQVIVSDIIKPTIQLNGAAIAEVSVFNNYVDPGVLVNDNYWPKNSIAVNKTSNLNINQIGTYYIWYVATDGSGNKDSIMRVVKVVDKTAPTVKILGTNPFMLLRWKEYSEPGVELIDNYNTDAQIRPYLIITSTLPKNAGGNYFGDEEGLFYVNYKVTDLSGNRSAEATRMVNVIANTSVEDVMNAENVLAVYPNPNNGKLKLKSLGNLKSEMKIEVLDILGNRIKSVVIGKNDMTEKVLDLSVQSSGVYFIHIEIDDKTFVKKISVVK